MQNRWSVLCSLLACVLLGSTVGVYVAAESESPTQLVQRLVKAITSKNQRKNVSLSATDQAANTAMAKEANAILDIPAVAQRTLGKHWQARSPAEQQEFIALLEQLFTKVAYPKSAEFFHSLEVNFAKENIAGQRATVKTTVRHPKEGVVSVDYRLVQEGSVWRVQDIFLVDVNLAANLQSQFNKIITENSYAEVLRRLREQLNE